MNSEPRYDAPGTLQDPRPLIGELGKGKASLMRKVPSAEAELVKLAEEIARQSHDGQVDKSGNPYIGHLERVAARTAAAAAAGPQAVAVAWLHDSVEDTGTTLDQLRQQGIPESVVTAVDAITKRPEEARDDYLRRVKAVPLALTVKAADVADNTDPQRMQALDEETRRRLSAKYAHTRAVLGISD